MVRSLYIENFKSIKKLDLACKQINVLIGPPNTGKSNILESIGLLSALTRLRRNQISNFVRMRSFVDLFFNKSLKNSIQIGYDSVRPRRETAGVHISLENGVYRFVFQFDQEGTGSKLEISADPNGNVESRPTIAILEKFKFYRFRELDTFAVGPYEYLEPPNGINLLGVLLTNDSLLQVVNELCASVGFKLILKEAEQSIELQKEFRQNVAVSFPLKFTSEGIQQAIFVLAAIYSNNNSVITLEEPEAHTFPYNTKALAETIALDSRGNQYFLSTHNPYFLMSLLEKAPKDQIQVFLTKFENQETRVTPLNEDQLGVLFEAGSDAFFNLESVVSN
jgi:AAA15 family ATPase/GTPase